MRRKHFNIHALLRSRRRITASLALTLAWVLAVSSAGSAAAASGIPTVLLQDLSSQADPFSAKEARDASVSELRVVGVPLRDDAGQADVTLVLRRIEVFSADARITIQTPQGETIEPTPRHHYFSGSIEDRTGSRAVLTLLEDGGVRGIVIDGGTWWRIGEVADAEVGLPEAIRVEARRLDLTQGADPFYCGNDQLPRDFESLLPALSQWTPPADRIASKGVGPSFTARIAFETDEEYLALFSGDTVAATDYIGDLVAIGSTVYGDEVETSWAVASVNLWTVADPWDESPGSCALFEFGKYWNDNNSGVDRTIAHMLSGKPPKSGIAWVGVLCTQTFGSFPIVTSGCVEVPTNIDGADYGGDYGFTGGIDGDTFDIDNPAPVWDSVGFLHEIGHNFNSPHTHCYNGIGGSADPIDECFSGQSGCYSGSTSLPSGCPGAGSNCGTIMSYCNQLPGGISGNMALTLGASWTYGTLPDRVPTRMSNHVVSQDGSNPGCLDLVATDTIFADGFESGNTAAWSSTVN